MKSLYKIVLACVLVMSGLFAQANVHADTLIHMAEKNGHFKTLLRLARAAGLLDSMNSAAVTVFAPTDEAFSKVPKKTMDYLAEPKNKEKLAALLKYHAIAGKVTSADLLKTKNGAEALSLEGGGIKITHVGKQIMVNQAKIVKADLRADNGVIHVLDAVLFPPIGKKK